MGVAGGGINKAELARTPKEVLWWRIWLTAIWASFCGGLHGFNTSNISGIMGMSAFLRDFGFKSLSKSQLANTEGWVVSAMLLGQLTGVILSGPANERFGRKFSIFCAATLYTVGAILMAANFGSLSELLVGRVFSGLGSGFGMTTGAIYISEISPKAIRGCLSTFYNVNIMAGVTAAYWTNYGSFLHISSTSSWQWRGAMIIQVIPAVALFAGLYFFPESPRFLALRGQEVKSKQVLLALRNIPEDHPYFIEEYGELLQKVTQEAEVEKGFKAYKVLLNYCASDPSTRKRVIFVIIIQTLFIMSGGNSITYYAPQILQSIGLNSAQILLFTSIYGCVKVCSVLLYAFVLTDRFGRRPLLLIGSTMNVLCLLYLSVFLGVAKIDATAKPTPAAWIAIVAICIFAIGYGFGWAPVFSLTTSEICPTRTRGTVVTLAFTYQNVLNFIITRFFPNMTAQMKPWGPFALFCAFTACGTIYIYFAFPECKNRSIEDMDIFFSMSWWKAGRASLRMNKEDAMQAILENKENGGKLFDSAVEKFSSSYIEETDVQRVRSS